MQNSPRSKLCCIKICFASVFAGIEIWIEIWIEICGFVVSLLFKFAVIVLAFYCCDFGSDFRSDLVYGYENSRKMAGNSVVTFASARDV